MEQMLLLWSASAAGVVCAVLGLQWLRRGRLKAEPGGDIFYSAVDQSQDGVVFVDAATLAIVDANPALSRSLGFTLAELRSLSLPDVFKDEAGDPDATLNRLRNPIPGQS